MNHLAFEWRGAAFYRAVIFPLVSGIRNTSMKDFSEKPNIVENTFPQMKPIITDMLFHFTFLYLCYFQNRIISIGRKRLSQKVLGQTESLLVNIIKLLFQLSINTSASEVSILNSGRMSFQVLACFYAAPKDFMKKKRISWRSNQSVFSFSSSDFNTVVVLTGRKIWPNKSQRLDLIYPWQKY